MSDTIRRMKKHSMSSLSPNNDARRTSPRKSAGRIPHYLAEESNDQKGVKGAKKSGGGVKKQAAKESESSSLSSDDDSKSVASAQPRKKSRGTTGGRMSSGTRSVGVSKGG